jgi:hypothetical protein
MMDLRGLCSPTFPESSRTGGDHSDGMWPRCGRPATLKDNAIMESIDSRSAGEVVIATVQCDDIHKNDHVMAMVSREVIAELTGP